MRLYNKNTTIDDVILYVREGWDLFVKEIKNQIIVDWLKDDLGKEKLADEIFSHAYTDWSNYPRLATIYIFDVLKRLDKDKATSFIEEFKHKYSSEIEKEFACFKERNKKIENIFGHQNFRPTLGFLLVEEKNNKTVYFLYEGENTYGSSALGDANHQLIAANEDCLEGKHFSILAIPNKEPFVEVKTGESLYITPNHPIRKEEVCYGTTLTLGRLKITILPNLNQ